MKRRLIYGMLIAVLAVNLAVGLRIYLSSAQAAGDPDSVYPDLDLFTYVLQKVRADYVDGQDLTYHRLITAALKGMVGSLDPHSEFMDAAEYHEFEDDTEGTFGGVGLVVTMKHHQVTVVTPMAGTPGYRAGIRSGDRIVTINGQRADQMGLQEAVKRLRGQPGSTVTMSIQRPSSGPEKEFTLTRAVIKLASVQDLHGQQTYPLGPDRIGYVRLTQFDDGTGRELTRVLKKLKSEGMKALILDLRWNPGGLLDEAVKVCSDFLPRGQLVVSTEGRNPGEDVARRADGHGDMLRGMPMVVLVNTSSASAAEIVTGCLQDLHRAIILGQKTFGKGSVQSVFPLADGSALKLTTAKYYTPSHRVINEVGITPDIIVPMSDMTQAVLELQRAPGGLASVDPKSRALLERVRDVQLDQAEDVLKGVLMYTRREGPAHPEVPEKVAAQ